MTDVLSCKTCGEQKPVAAFWKTNSRRGYAAECKPCNRSRNQAWVDANRDRYRELNKVATNKKRRKDPVKAMLSLARSRCKKSGLEFTLTPADIQIPEFCPILGIKLTLGLGQGWGQKLVARDTSASLDRIDNSKGYIPGNVVVVSYRANRIKSDATVSELLRVARFYAQLDANKDGRADVPAMQPHEEEEKC